MSESGYIARNVALRFARRQARLRTPQEANDFLMGPGWKVVKDDGRETVYANQALGYEILVRHQSWAQHHPIIVRWDGGENDGFKFVPDALAWIRSHPKRGNP